MVAFSQNVLNVDGVIHTPLNEMGREAAPILVRRMSQPKSRGRRKHLPVQLVERRSCQALASDTHGVNRTGEGHSMVRVLATMVFENVFAQPDVLMTTDVRPPSMMRLAQALGISDYMLSVDEVVDYTRRHLGKP